MVMMPLWTWHLHLQVGVVWNSQRLGQSWSSQQHMIRAAEVHYLEPYALPAEVSLVAEEDVQLDFADRQAGLPRNDPVEDSASRQDVRVLEPELEESVEVEDVDVAATVDQHPGESAGESLGREGGVKDECV